MLLPGLLAMAYLYHPDNLPWRGTAHSGLGPPTLITNPGTISETCLQDNPMEAFSQLRESLSLNMFRFVSS